MSQKRTFFACVFSLGCGSLAPVPDGDAVNGRSGSGGGTQAGGGMMIIPGTGGTSSGSGGTGAVAFPGGAGGACAVDTQNAELSPVNIVFVYDKSGSMGNTDDGFDPAARWDPMRAGMLAFFSDPSSSSISAALSFFPVNGDLAAACGGPYDRPEAASPRGLSLMALATDDAKNTFISLLQNTAPEGGTPTLPALQGGVRLAREIASAHPGAKTVVVLVTDGEPGFYVDGQVQNGCPDNDVSHVAETAAGALAGTPSIPTYVVGIGPSLDSLHAIARAGGTEQATIMSDADPSATSANFHRTLAAIRTQQFSCDFPLPTPPPEQTFESVNVVFASSAGTEAVIPRNDDCSPGGGWHYDVANAPRKIVLCSESCDEIQPDPEGELRVVFGCATVVR